MNEGKTRLSIKVGDVKTIINYMSGDDMIVSHTHPVGYKHVEADGMSLVAGSKFIDGILYTLEFISLHDRIPTQFTLVSPRYSTWFSEVIERNSYSQFFTDGVPISVTLENITEAPLSYARHSKTIQSFKL